MKPVAGAKASLEAQGYEDMVGFEDFFVDISSFFFDDVLDEDLVSILDVPRVEKCYDRGVEPLVIPKARGTIDQWIGKFIPCDGVGINEAKAFVKELVTTW